MDPDFEVLGLVADIVPPVYSTFVPTPQGVTVLYGLNGAGKTKLLLALRSGLEGRNALDDGDSDIVVRAAYADDPDDHADWVRRYAASWANQDEVVWTPATVSPELAEHPIKLIGRAVEDSLETDRAWFDSEPGPELDIGLLSMEIAAQGIFLISSEFDEGFAVRAGAMAIEGAPLVNLASRKLHTVHKRRLADGKGRDDDIPGIFDPFHGDFSTGVAFDSLMDPSSHLPPLVDVIHSGKVVRLDRLADVITDESSVPDVGQTLRELSSLGVKATKKNGLTRKGVEFLDGLQALAQGLLDNVLLDAPHIVVTIGTPRDWMLGRPPVWVARHRSSPDRVIDISKLSRAECRWATLAIALATQVTLDRERLKRRSWARRLPLFIVLDEPEAALHRSAETFMAEGLLRWASVLGAHVVVASHSPELLDLPASHLLSVARTDNGNSAVRPLSAPTKETMGELGLRPSDLLRRQRGFLLVEGTHDQIVLEELIGDELRRSRIDIVPLRGAKQLPATVDSQFLFDYTDAHVVVMLDAIDAEKVRSVWERTVETAAKGDRDKAGQLLRESLPGNAPELRWMREFLSKAVDRDIQDRLTPFGLRALDVIDYLPVDSLVPGSSSWEELRADYNSARRNQDFKSWLTATRRASFAPDRIRSAAQALDSVPDELVALSTLCATL